jgi:hypothetical protein
VEVDEPLHPADGAASANRKKPGHPRPKILVERSFAAARSRVQREKGTDQFQVEQVAGSQVGPL